MNPAIKKTNGSELKCLQQKISAQLNEKYREYINLFYTKWSCCDGSTSVGGYYILNAL